MADNAPDIRTAEELAAAAGALRAEIIDKAGPVLEVLDRARKAGFQLNFNCGFDVRADRHIVQSVDLIRHF